MSRKDYVAIAALLRDHANTLSDPTQAWDIAVADLVNDVADLFAADNPNFDRRRFLEAATGRVVSRPMQH
jgi:hypothetical protein